jgi:alkylresorcinol/alkylpyrone synthase
MGASPPEIGKTMRIVGAASAFPEHYYSQEMLLGALQEYWGDQLENPHVLRRLHRHVGVDGRFLSLPKEEYLKMKTWGEANHHWIRTAKDLGEKAVAGALAHAGLHGRNLGAFFFVSVTGISSPSIDALLINKMGLCRNIRRVPIFGLGCVAGAAAISRAADYVRAYPDQAVVVLSVELCSLTIQREDVSMANLISSSLFGDGAAAVIVAGADCGLSGPSILATRSVFYPDTEEMMGWDVSEKGFRIVLSREIPNLVRKNLAHDLDDFLAERGLTRADIGSWALHTGGPKILEATAEALGLNRGELDVSWHCLRRTGNLSSASVLVVLEEVMKNRRPAPGTLGLLAAMGPGFCSEFVLLEW